MTTKSASSSATLPSVSSTAQDSETPSICPLIVVIGYSEVQARAWRDRFLRTASDLGYSVVSTDMALYLEGDKDQKYGVPVPIKHHPSHHGAVALTDKDHEKTILEASRSGGAAIILYRSDTLAPGSLGDRQFLARIATSDSDADDMQCIAMQDCTNATLSSIEIDAHYMAERIVPQLRTNVLGAGHRLMTPINIPYYATLR